MANTLPDNMISVPLAIICEGDRAEIIPGPPPFMNIVFDARPPSKYQAWFIESYKDEATYTIRNLGSKCWACARGSNVQATSKFDPATCVWHLQKAGGIQFKILAPNQDLVWTVKEFDMPKTVCLELPDVSPAQLFTFQFTKGDWFGE